jgi:phosphatidate phosphatase APP1
MKTRLTIIALALITTVSSLQAKTLIVSDIDDTIKMTNVLGTTKGKVINGLFKHKSFAGMNSLYKNMVQSDTVMYYVSGSPKIMKSWIEVFLKINKFPQSQNFYLKGKISDDTFHYKVETIKEIIARETPDDIILIGDDTEYDPGVYKQISEEHPGLVRNIYIRSIQNKKIEGVTTFFSSVEIAGQEIIENRMDVNKLEQVVDAFVKQKNRSVLFIKERYCPKDGSPAIELLKEKFSDAKTIELLDKTQQKIIKSCK